MACPTGPLEPCARCKAPEGWRRAPGCRPERTSGTPYGLDGVLCHDCAAHLKREQFRAEWRRRNNQEIADG